MARPDARSQAYRRRLAAIRAEVLRRIIALYGDELDPAEILTSMATWTEQATVILEGGQASIAALTEAYLEELADAAGTELGFDDTTERLAGTTRAGMSLAEGMAAFGPMVLAQIANGRNAADALEYGRYLAERFADAEMTGVVDRIHEDPLVRTRLAGWDCTVQPDACDGCLENAGRHELTWVPYRHGNCHCEVEAVFVAAA